MTIPDGTSLRLMNRLRLRHVALLLAIESGRTLHAASDQLGMSQPAATKMLHELESAIGQPLFDRVGRGLQLNATGRCVLGHFRGMRGSVTALTRELHELQLGSAGKLFIGSIMAASPAHLSDALIRLKAVYPLISVEISVGTSDHLLALLQQGTLDLVIGRTLDSTSQDYQFRPIAEEALSIVVAVDHPLKRRRKVAFAELLAYPWILQPHGSPMRDVMEREFQGHRAQLPAGLIETASILTTTNLIARTEMIAVIPQSVASRYEKHGLLAILPYQISQSLAAYGSIVRSDRPGSVAVERFLALLHGEAV